MLEKASGTPLYQQLADTLRGQILGGQLKPGDRLPSEAQMMACYGVGRLTVRNALSSLVAEGLLEKVQGKGTFCRAAEIASLPRIEVILDMCNTYFIPYYVKGISEVLREGECSYLISDTSSAADALCRRLEGALDSGVSGVIFQLTQSRASEAELGRIRAALDRMRAAGVPCVMIDSRLEGADVSWAAVDEKAGASRAAEHLAAYRHRRCAIVWRPGYLDSTARRDSFLWAAERFGMEKIVEIDCDRGADAAVLDAVKNAGVTGIFGYNDEIALRCMRTLQGAGIEVPKQVSVVGYDDSYLAETIWPSLTSVSHPKETMGRHVASALLRLIRGQEQWPYTELFQPRLVCRGSCSLCPGYRA